MPAVLPRVTTTTLPEAEADWLIVGISEGTDFPPEVSLLDTALDGGLARLRARGELAGKLGDLTVLPLPHGIRSERLVLVGLGTPAKLTIARWEQALLTALRKAAGTPSASVAIAAGSEAVERLGLDTVAMMASYAAIVGAAGQGIYKTEPDRYQFREITILVTAETTSAQQAADRGRILGEAVNLTRELVNRHPEDIYPDTFATRAASEAAAAGIRGEIFDLHRLEQERMNALLAVARGSAHEPRAVVLEYHGAGDGAPWLALCGKGVTFDSGGLSLKPSDSMLTMKGDMAGAATVLGAMIAIARLKLPVNVLGVMGLVENMVGPSSYKLGEVLTARNGVTIEVHNTDAEGRLVLADVLSYAVDRKPEKLIDLATLTGSCVVALGMDVAGAFSNDQSWCDEVLAAARRAGEEVWQLPTYESYAEQLKCDFADIKNVGTKWGGAITAAKFLERFVGGLPWVHLDIAGPSYVETAKPYRDVGATGSSVRTLVEVAQKLAKT